MSEEQSPEPEASAEEAKPEAQSVAHEDGTVVETTRNVGVHFDAPESKNVLYADRHLTPEDGEQVVPSGAENPSLV
jgi:hypothetical protein